MGNSSGADAEAYALITLAPDTDTDAGFITGLVSLHPAAYTVKSANLLD